jgi:tRNA U34 5-methylaminomethyl-2-thiouridine-forming methyltransferase MnmC
MEYKVKMTADGSHTIYLPQMDEQYHSLNGAVTESAFVYINMGYLFNREDNPVIFEAGFGTGLNCLLTALTAEEVKRPTSYIAIEKFPLEENIINQLNYGKVMPGPAAELFRKIHECKWEDFADISPYFQLYKMHGDLTESGWQVKGGCNIIYYDAFAPGKQKEMWTAEIFRNMFEMTLPGGVIVTYSASGEVRRGLADAGYTMERLPGPPGKKEMLRGIKIDSNI